jgi:CRP-like cAMP-binding protein
VQIEQEPAAAVPGDDHARARLLDEVEILTSLTDEQRAQLIAASRALLYEAGQAIVREGDPGASMFVLRRGEASVTLAHTDGELARHREGGFFGEMSLLTGDARSATVTAVTDCELIEIGVEAFRRVVLADAAIVDRVTAAVAKRRAELDQHRATRTSGGTVTDTPQTLVARVRRFLRL